ncbi:MAG: ATP-binding cassette domain-containing protein [Planctomycetota bacterium]
MDATKDAASGISIRGLRKVYRPSSAREKPVVAIDELDLEIPAGEIFGLIGPNGAGKTTLLKLLATLIPPSCGALSVAGFDCDREREQVCGRIGFMPETFSLYEDLSVEEYLEFFASAYGVPSHARRKTLDAVIELTDLGVRRASATGTLSKGMRQRVLMAKTLIHDPEVLLLDEPTSGMDPQARIEFRNVVRTLGKMGKTIVVSSHILHDLSAICTSFGIMECGRMRLSGSLAEVTRRLEMGSRIEVEFLPGGPDPLSLLEGFDGVKSPEMSQNRIVFAFRGPPEQKAEILRRLIERGVSVTHFIEKASDIEDVFLKVGATRVQ